MLMTAALLSCVSASARATPPPVGTLTELGCISVNGSSDEGAGTCATATGIATPADVILSPDARNAYVGSTSKYLGFDQDDWGSITVFTRAPASGRLTELGGKAGCFTIDGSTGMSFGMPTNPGTCSSARALPDSGLGSSEQMALTPDGHWLYVASSYPGILIFRRNPSTGALTQLSGTTGCITADGSSQDGPGTCQKQPLVGSGGISFSPDGRFLYLAQAAGDAVRLVAFARNTTTGRLTEVQCLTTETNEPVGCIPEREVGAVVVTPNGKYAYTGVGHDDGASSCPGACGIGEFDRNPSTGKLTQKTGPAGCVTDDGTDTYGVSGSCSRARVVGDAAGLTISPDGRTLYAPSSDDGFSVFHIGADGTLTQPTTASACVTSNGDDQLGNPTCTVARALAASTTSLPAMAAIPPDGRTLYMISTPGVSVFSLNQATGTTTQLPGLDGCITADGSSDGTPGLCGKAAAVASGSGIAASPTGNSIYIAVPVDQPALSILARETAPMCSPASVKTAPGAAVTIKLSCADADGQPIKRAIVSRPRHGSLGPLDQANGTVRYKPAAKFAGTDTFTFAASDGTNTSTPAKITVFVQSAK